MATQNEILERLDTAATNAENATDAYNEVLKSEGEQDIPLVDGTTTPNLNKRIKNYVTAVKSVNGKTGEVVLVPSDIVSVGSRSLNETPSNDPIPELIDSDGMRDPVSNAQAQALLNRISYLKESTTSVVDVKSKGLKLDGSDETDKFLDIVDSMQSGKIIIRGGTLRLSKTSRHADRFPKNDQPCVPLLDKTNFTIFIDGDAEVITDKHAQGIFEMIRCVNTHIVGTGKITGAGNFPPLDGTSGRGEKGVAGSGYATSGFWGYYKNNSYDTTASTAGGFGGAFPQWGGGTAPYWGLHNGGFIGNQGIGVLMHDGCVNCSASSGLDISGFNGGPSQIGWNGDYVPVNTGALDSVNCMIFGCTLRDSYNLGVALLASDGAKVFNNIISNMGHPSALETNLTSDPGYGVSCITSIYSPARNSKVFNNRVTDCKRKGLDVHAGYDNQFYDNYVSDCRIGGLFSAWSSADQPAKGTIFRNNTVVRCGWFSGSPNASEGGLLVQGLNQETPSIVDTIAEENIFIDCWGYNGIIQSRYSDGLKFNKNIVKGYHPDATVPTYVGMFGNFVSGNVGNSRNFEINDNVFDVISTRGLQINKAIGKAERNKVYKTKAIGIYYNGGNGAFQFDFKNNHVEVSEGLAYAVSGTSGEVVDNTHVLSGTATLGTTKSLFFDKPSLIRSVSFFVTFNGTTSPTVDKIKGGSAIQSVATSATGVDFVFSGIDPNATVTMTITQVSSNSPATSAPAYGQYLYARSIGPSSGSVGIKTNGAATGHIAGDALVSGKIRIDLTIY